MRNLIICCDGTWQTPDQEENGIPTPSNVVRLFNAVSKQGDNGEEQLKYYHPGVGTEGSWWQKTLGGSVGVGLGDNIKSAYRWLGGHYQAGDRIFLFGFSRGAYTARSLGGMISRAGLLKLTGLAEKEVWKRVSDAYDKGYRAKAPKAGWSKDWEFHPVDAGTGKVTIHFVGVWDTVGALGIPDDLSILNFLIDRQNYTFHDTRLGANVAHARHAMAIDELRASFTPTLWTEAPAGCDVKQLWFPGVHSDVGGGYPEVGLSDGALQWMLDEAAAAGLSIEAGIAGQVKPDERGVLHHSDRGAFRLLRTQPRSVPCVSNDPAMHASSRGRHATPPITQAPYRPTRILAVGEHAKVSVYALNPWNETGIFLESGGEYHFVAEGEWLDRTIACGPGGASDGKFQAGEIIHLAGSLWGKVEGFFQNVTGNMMADFKGTRRHEAKNTPWFILMGAVANGGEPQTDGTPSEHETFPIGASASKTVTGESGYLYCYANDAWGFYDNNRGSVLMTVTRVR